MENQEHEILLSENSKESLHLHLPFLVVGQTVLESKPTRMILSVGRRSWWGLTRWHAIVNTQIHLIEGQKNEKEKMYKLDDEFCTISKLFWVHGSLPLKLKLKDESRTLHKTRFTMRHLVQEVLLGLVEVQLGNEPALFYTVCVDPNRQPCKSITSLSPRESKHSQDQDQDEGSLPTSPPPPCSLPCPEPISQPLPRVCPVVQPISLPLLTPKITRATRGMLITPSLAVHPAESTSRVTSPGTSWKLPQLVSITLVVLMCLGLLGLGQIYRRGQPLFQSSEENSFPLFNIKPLEDELEQSDSGERNQVFLQRNVRFNDQNSKQDNKSSMDIETLKVGSCRTTVKGVQYNGSLSHLLHFPDQDIRCVSWSRFDVNVYKKKSGFGDVKQWMESDNGELLFKLPSSKKRKKIEDKLQKSFRSVASASSFCRNFGGLFSEPSCLVDEASLHPIDSDKVRAISQGKSMGDTMVVSCGVPLCPAYYGPHAGKQCKVTQSGTESKGKVCVPFLDYPPSGSMQCKINDNIEGPTYTWTHPSEGYSLNIPTAARPCHNLRQAVVVKGGYQSRIWFQMLVPGGNVNLKIHPYSDEKQVELILQYRYSADRADEGYNVGLTSRHFHAFHAQHLVHLSRGHVPVITDYTPLSIWNKLLQLKRSQSVQYKAQDVVPVMNAGALTHVNFNKKDQEAQLSFQGDEYSIKMITPSETTRFPEFVRMFSDDLVEVQMDTFCPIVHVFKPVTFESDLRRTYSRNTHTQPSVNKATLQKLRHPVKYFNYIDEGVYFQLQRKKHSTSMIFYHYHNKQGEDEAKILFTTFPRLAPALVLQLKPPYRFQFVKNFLQPPMEWESREEGPFEPRDLSEGWHGYSVRLTKATFHLHHISRKGKATLIYKANFFQFEPPFVYAFLSASGGKFTVNCQPRYEEYMNTPKGARINRLTLMGVEYVGFEGRSRSGRRCLSSQHSPQAVCRTWNIGEMLYHGPSCRVLTDKDFDMKLNQLGIDDSEEKYAIKKNMSVPESSFFGFGFESCDVRHKHENDPSFHYFSVLHTSDNLQTSELIDVRTIRNGKLEFGFISAHHPFHSSMSIVFLDKFTQKRMQITLAAFKRYVVVKAFRKDEKDKVRSSSLSQLQLITQTNYSHCQLWMSNIYLSISCWDFDKKQMSPIMTNFNYKVVIEDKRDDILQYIRFGTDLQLHSAVVKKSVQATIDWFDSESSTLKPNTNMWRVRLPCPWFELPPSTTSHLRPLRLDQDYFLELSHNSVRVSLNLHNSVSPKQYYERPLEVTLVPGKLVQIRHVNKYNNITHEYKTDPLENKLIFSVSKLDIKLWLNVVQQLCPMELRTILKVRHGTAWINNPKQTIIFDKNLRSWQEESLTNLNEELKRKNLNLKWFPTQCWQRIPINTYVLLLRDRLRRIKFIIQVNDLLGLDGATLEFFSIQTQRQAASFSVNDKSCKPLDRTRIHTYKDSRLVLTSKGTCSKTCGEGFRLMKYSCERPMNGYLCTANQLGIQTDEQVDKLTVWGTCNQKPCYDFKTQVQQMQITVTNMTVALGEQFKLTCIDKDYEYSIKKDMPADGQLEVHWFRNEKHHHEQGNSIVMRVRGMEDTGLYHCYVRYNGGQQHYLVKAVGVILEHNELHVMIFEKYQFKMRADYLLDVLQHQAMAFWFHRRNSNDSYRKIKSGFMSLTETYSLKELKEEELGEYLGCLKPFPGGIPVDALLAEHVDNVVCPVHVQLVLGTYSKMVQDYISMLPPIFDRKYLVVILVLMRVIELITDWLYTRRKLQKMDFQYKTNFKITYGDSPLYT